MRKRNLIRDHMQGKVNTSHEQIIQNIKDNIRRPLPQAQPYPPQKDVKVMLLCGGPSAKAMLKEIKSRRKRGWKIATVNGTHDWCLDNGLTPSVHFMLDARPWNVRFVQRPVKECRYLIGSQCDPSVFDALEGHDVTIWHGVGKAERPILDKYYNKRYAGMAGGTTVGIHAISLLYLLGFRHIAIYGMDSCIQKGKHHSYEQPENDGAPVQTVKVGRKTFYANPWMTAQADELMQLLPLLADDINLDFRGDNLISYIIRYIAENKKAPRITITKEDK